MSASQNRAGPAVRAEGLVKTFGTTRALDGVDLEIPTGTVLGLLGPNGAGKTTMVRILTTLLRPDSGRAWVAGHDVTAEPDAVRRRIGLSGQYAAVDGNLTGFENLYMVARLYGMSRRAAAARARALLQRFRLAEDGARPAKEYSGGMQRRLDLAGALIAEPAVVVLDEPTTGLDPRGRQDTWDVIGVLVADGATVLLTTQYLEEADRLADTIAVIDGGRVIAHGSPDELKAQIGGERLELVVAEADQVATARTVLAQIGVGEPTVNQQLRRLSVAVDVGPKALLEVLRRFESDGPEPDPATLGRPVEVLDIALRRPTLDDVFLSLTGHRADGENADGENADAEDTT
ncbi:MAG: type transport system ATP-binding protein [Pseudonocardiales bacterium]|nr:type transport system ATP-binding protein [Pseudonocardiales bacterium]